MTKILYVHGDDYATTDFKKLRDNGTVDPADLWADSYAYGESKEFETEHEYFEYTALLFKDIDPEFIDFVKNELIDYDAGKAANIYAVEE